LPNPKKGIDFLVKSIYTALVFTNSTKTKESEMGTNQPKLDFRVLRVAPGYYLTQIEVVMQLDGHTYIKTANVEIAKRDGMAGWYYTITVPYANGVGAKLSQGEDLYATKAEIISHLKSLNSRFWTFYTKGGLNCWVAQS